MTGIPTCGAGHGRTMLRVLAVVVAGIAPAGAGEPVPEVILREATTFLATRPAFSFDWIASHDEIVEGREKITRLRSGSTVMVRDVGFFTRIERVDGVREYFYDGATFTAAAPDEGFYASAPFAGGFEALVDEVNARAGVDIPLWSMLSRDLPETVLEGVESSAHLGTASVGGRRAHHLAFSDRDQDWQIWIADDAEAPLVLMIVGTHPYAQGWPQFRAELRNWNLAPEPGPDAFVHVPGAGDVRIGFPTDLDASGRPGGD